MRFDLESKELFYTDDRKEWRRYLEDNFETAKELWLVYPMKGSGVTAE